ncbi:mesoderm induction early response protein 3 isoform X4 [Anarhichas minor]|uniref:mesoderm induction early response protein 3 isoform X4 n=1 Tax=Anarhichas minor TaxID=65739 RepID=UPI003F73CBDB
MLQLIKEGNMPLEELLAIYRYEASAGSSIDSSSGDLTDELPDMTLDKEEIAKDLLSGDYEEETQSSADDLTPSVTSHEATDFFPRTLRSNAISDGDKESECEEDGPSPEDSRKEIMVGSQYQAEVPSGLCHYKDEEKVYEDEDELLWSPGKLAESKVRTFLSDVLSRTTNEKTGCDKPWMHVRDDEQALAMLPRKVQLQATSKLLCVIFEVSFLLGRVEGKRNTALLELAKCNYNIREALERHCIRVKSSKEKSPPWSEEECKSFEHALQMYDKNFHLIQKHKVTTRTVAECVAFYYMWKKSERFDIFVQQNRFGKKKYSSYPGVTDLMDRLVDEAEGLAVDSSSSVCSGAGGGGRLETTTDQQLSLLNSITASDLTALSNTVATVCNPAEVGCIDSYSFPPLESLHRGSLNHDESLGFSSNGSDPDCLNMLDAGFYHSDLGQLGGVCVNKDCERPSKRLKLALPDSFINDVSVGNLGVDFEARRTTTHHHRITGAKMAVSVTDFGSLAGSGEPNGFLGAHARHHTQHTAALQSE